jgi:myo-inositol-1(or 4)-monophosphatase
MAELSQTELAEIYAFAVELGRQAGQMLMDAAKLRMGDGSATREQKEHIEKENAVDLVTETDEGALSLLVYLKMT